MTEIALTGGGGLLGSAFRDMLGSAAVVLGRHELDIERPEGLLQRLEQIGPKVIINCAAHTNVEGAESSPELDRSVNARLPGMLAEAAARTGAVLVHFSSTGCYGAWKSEPYVESDPVQPTTAHHRHKIEGERLIQAAGCEHLILRTGWLFGGDKTQAKNFVWKRILEAMSCETMTSDASQRGCPTHVADLVAQTLALLQAGERGLFNVVAQGGASRYEYVAAIVEFAGLACSVRPGEAFRRIAPVSPNEVAENARLQAVGCDRMPPWRDALAKYIRSELMPAAL